MCIYLLPLFLLLLFASYILRYYYYYLWFDSLRPHELQPTRLPCPSLPPGFCSNPFESVMPSNHFILCHPLLLLPSIFPSIRVFSNESALCIRWSRYWNFSFSISPSSEYWRLISFRIDCFDLLTVQGQQHKWSYCVWILMPWPLIIIKRSFLPLVVLLVLKHVSSDPTIAKSMLGLPRWHSCKESDTGDVSSIPGSGRFPGVGKGNPLQYSWLENSMDRGTWWSTVPGVTKSWTNWVTELSMHASMLTVDLGICSSRFYFQPLWDLRLSLLDNILLSFAFLVRQPGSAF